MPGREAIKAKLAAVASAYRASLPGRIAEMDSLCREFSTQPPSHDAAVELYRLAHSMAGSAATFGYARLAALSGALESMLHEAAREGAEILPGLIGDIRVHIAELSREVGAMAAATRRDLPEYEVAESAPDAPGHIAHPLVFLADDDALFTRDLALRLLQHDYRVRTFTTLQSLRNALADGRPDLLIMDMIFPEGSGADLVRELRLDSGRDFPVVFVSVDSGQAARLAALRAGGRAFIPKPVNTGRLIDTLDALVRRMPDQPYRILVLDDSAEEAAYYAALLKDAGMEVETLTEAMAALSHIEHFNPEILLADLYMPECSGVELVRMLRQIDAHLELPIIFLSGEQDMTRQVSALGSGADAFISKQTPPHDMVPLLTGMAARYRLLRSIMSNDSLTGLLAHSKIMDALARELARGSRNSTELSFVMIDIDHFKSINDTYGHPVGDRVLRALARFMKHRLRQTDYLGRYGGEEFSIIMPDTTVEQSRLVIDQLRQDFSSMEFEEGNANFRVTFSAGIAGSPPQAEASLLVEAADKALYAAKQQGRNRVIVAG